MDTGQIDLSNPIEKLKEQIQQTFPSNKNEIDFIWGPELKLQVFTYCDKDPVNEYEQQRKELP